MIDWDGWRARYRTMTAEDQAQFYAAAADAHPDQVHYNLAAAKRAIHGHAHIVEIGGWRGELADDVLTAFSTVKGWENREIAPVEPACHDPRYRQVQAWGHEDIIGNVLVMSHVIEHMLLEDVRRIPFERFACVYIDAPLPMDGPADWRGFTGTHIADFAWRDLDVLLAERDHAPAWSVCTGPGMMPFPARAVCYGRADGCV